MQKVERVIFQYSDSCNMRCPYCYCPFINKRVDPDLGFSIIKRCSQIGAKIITFGGGDPFMYDSFRELVAYSYKLGLECHVDTNAIAIGAEDYELISNYISLLSLPLDGPNDLVHTNMRGMSGHFDVVINCLNRMINIDCTLKINTVVALSNRFYLVGLANLLKDYPIEIWSLFQFWVLGMGVKNQKTFKISDSEYNFTINKLSQMDLPFHLERGTVKQRKGYHFFVTHTGMVYTHDKIDLNHYKFLGSIFDDQVIEKWSELACSSIHPQTVTRYKNILEK